MNTQFYSLITIGDSFVKTNIHFALLQISPFQVMADTWFYDTIIVALFYNLLLLGPKASSNKMGLVFVFFRVADFAL